VRNHFFSDEATIVEKDKACFHQAVRIFVCTILDSETPRDVQYIYLAPGEDHQIQKDLLMVPRDHARRFKEMLRIAELLPLGEMPPLSEKLAVQWYYMKYHRANRAEYVKWAKNCPTRPSRCFWHTFSRFFLNTKTTARSKSMRSSGCVTAPSGRLRTIFVRSARHAAQTTLVARCASMSAGDTTEVDRTAEVAMIDAAPATTDRDATDTADKTINRNAETATVEAIAGGNTTATTVERRQRKGRGKKTATIKKIDVTIAIDATTATVVKKLKRTTPTITTQVTTTTRKTTTKIRMSTTTMS
jgi:hypothetical protein